MMTAINLALIKEECWQKGGLYGWKETRGVVADRAVADYWCTLIGCNVILLLLLLF
jgi:hypothetical protein